MEDHAKRHARMPTIGSGRVQPAAYGGMELSSVIGVVVVAVLVWLMEVKPFQP
jgi:hypothetical protein